ncbi:hypothetical protein DL96DRAFT_1808703 [Flagelloscypha sp. PMI_526]|nr:hypothetical protein DL96DRAFT_1808703 [Flagelloscypha sp. PMI_526]
MESSEKRSSLASSIQSQLLEERAEPHVQENPKQPPPTKLFGIPQYHTGYAGYHGARNFDYDSKYPNNDPPGEEASDIARVWMIYNDEAEMYDDDMLRGFRDTIDSLLVFAALFSAVVTTLLVQTSAALEPNHAQITTYLLAEQIMLLRANGNLTSINLVAPSRLGPDSSTHSFSDISVCVLFFVSLALSLSTALFSILVKQWLTAYASKIPGTPKDVALIRNFRFFGLRKWMFPELIGVLPLALHASLWIFAGGLLLYVWQRDLTVFCATISVLSVTGIIYSVSLLVPPFYEGCPYHIPFLDALIRYTLVNTRIFLVYISRWPKYLSLCARKEINRLTGWYPSIRSRWIVKPMWYSQPWLLRSQWERVAAFRPHNLCDAVIWLYDYSSNPTIRNTAAKSLAGILPMDGDALKNRNKWAWLGDPRGSSDPPVKISLSTVVCQDICRTIWSQMASSAQKLPTSSKELHSAILPSSPSYNPWVRAESSLHSWTFYWLQRGPPTAPQLDYIVTRPFTAVSHCRSINHSRRALFEYIVYCEDVWNPGTQTWDTHSLDWGYQDSGGLANPLMAVGQYGLSELVKPVSNKVDVNILGLFGHSAVTYAITFEHIATVKALIAAGADLTLPTNPALTVACRTENMDIVRLLLDQPGVIESTGGEINLVGSPFFQPIEHGNLELVQLLLDKGVEASLNRRNQLKDLARSVEKGGREILDMLDEAWGIQPG